MKKNILSMLCLVFCMTALSSIYALTISSDAIVVINPPKTEKEKTTSADLQRRVWELEKAVYQLQRKVFDLESKPVTVQETSSYTCYISSFGETFTATSQSEMQARASVIKQCSDASNAIHCKDSDVKCGK